MFKHIKNQPHIASLFLRRKTAHYRTVTGNLAGFIGFFAKHVHERIKPVNTCGECGKPFEYGVVPPIVRQLMRE